MMPDANVRLAAHCTLGVGGAARWFWRAESPGSLRDALAWASERQVPVHVLGGGSNVVFADEGFDGLVVAVALRGVRFEPQGDGSCVVDAAAGEPWDELVESTVARGLAGLECLSGIPGLVGGTPVQNVGAYGQDVAAVIAHVEAIDRLSLDPVVLTNEQCRFAYRTSRFKREDRDRFVVTAVRLVLRPGPPTLAYADVASYFAERHVDAPSLAEARQAIVAIRRRKGMVIEAGNAANQSVGSFFVNPVIARSHFEGLRARHEAIPHYPAGEDRVKVPAAWLIERAGFVRGTRRGRVGISPLQAQAILNLGGASAADVLALAVEIKTAVRRAFAIAIVPEPVFVGFPPASALRHLQDHDGSSVE
jgi:UDP-N-acetylmuramate dehydrogenase